MDKEKAQELRDVLTMAASRIGVNLEIGTITFGENTATFSAKVYEGMAGKKEEFLRFCTKKGIPMDWFGKAFRGSDGERYQITGILPRGRKYILEVKGTDGKAIKCSKNFVREIF